MNPLHALQSLIESAFEKKEDLTPQNGETPLKEAVQEVLTLLESGKLHVAEKKEGQWITHAWVKQAVLLSFRLFESQAMSSGFSTHFDKIPPPSVAAPILIPPQF